MQECGPRFTLKLVSLQHGTFDTKGGEFEWVHKVTFLYDNAGWILCLIGDINCFPSLNASLKWTLAEGGFSCNLDSCFHCVECNNFPLKRESIRSKEMKSILKHSSVLLTSFALYMISFDTRNHDDLILVPNAVLCFTRLCLSAFHHKKRIIDQIESNFTLLFNLLS